MITLIIGGQYGGEGKGKVAAFLSKQERFSIVCRTGGVNSKHTVIENAKQYDLRLIPSACVSGFWERVVYGAGSLIHVPTLFKEMKEVRVSKSSVLIDRQTGVLTERHTKEQRADKRYVEIGSTLTGTGYATAQRALRKLSLAEEFSELSSMIGDTVAAFHDTMSQNRHILVEGHQSAGLSNYHGDYPYVSNRDSTAAALLSELGIGPRYPLRIVLVIKAFPTRNHNGRLPNEVNIEEVDALGIREYGGGSWGIENNRRRVGRIELKDIKRAVHLNTPTEIALTGADYLDPKSKRSTSWNDLSSTARVFIDEIEKVAGIPVSLVSTGPETDSMIYRK